MDIVLLLMLAISPGIAFCLYINYKDRMEKEPRSLLVKAFFLGVISIFPAIFLELAGEQFFPLNSNNLVSVLFYATVIVGLSEEAVKYFFIKKVFYPHPAFSEPLDGIVYALMVGMGFATIENIFYVLDHENPFFIGFLRMFMAIPAHAIFAIVMGYYMGMAKYVDGKDMETRRRNLLLTGIGAATILHGGYDFFLIQQNYPVLIFGAFVVLGIGMHYAKKAIAIHLRA